MDISARLELLKALGARVRADPSACSHAAAVISRHSLLTEDGCGLAPGERVQAAEAVDGFLQLLAALLEENKASPYPPEATVFTLDIYHLQQVPAA